jgi:hypothetical protein
LRITIRAKPASRAPRLSLRGEMLEVAVREAAVDGRANAAICRAVARWLRVPPSAVEIVSGAAVRLKRLEIAEVTQAEFERACQALREAPPA